MLWARRLLANATHIRFKSGNMLRCGAMIRRHKMHEVVGDT
jgi:hypothetical protein